MWDKTTIVLSRTMGNNNRLKTYQKKEEKKTDYHYKKLEMHNRNWSLTKQKILKSMDKKFLSPFEATLTPPQILESFLKVLSQRGSHFV